MMANGAMRQVARLFEAGVATSQGDGQLLARFALDRDERAFEALVDRHGSMVWATCRAVLRDPHDAEDAFQAAFVMLARRPTSVRKAEALGGWLHRVAYREAVRVGVRASRRRASERAAALARPAFDAADDAADDELRLALHAELDRLPEVYRQALILCDLEGLSKGEAAHRLGWTEGSVRGRLDRARELLRARLGRRGLGATAGTLAAAIGREASAAIPAARATAAVRAALAASKGAWSVGLASSLAALRLGIASALLVGSAGLIAGLLALARTPAPAPPAIKPRPPAAKAPAAAPAITPAPASAPAPAPAAVVLAAVVLAGRVVDPDGKPVAGARVYRPLDWNRTAPKPGARPEVRALSGPDGRFRFSIARAEFESPWKGLGGQVLVLADGFGPAMGDSAATDAEATLRLAADDLPIEGRILDLEGRPVAGATVRVDSIQGPKAGTLDPWIEAARLDRKAWFELNNELLDAAWLRGSNLGAVATTDADGRFRLRGIGRERMVMLKLDGPTIRSYELHAATREMPDLPLRVFQEGITAGNPELDQIRATFHGRAFVHAAAPTRPVVGTVRDRATGAPLAGVSIRSYKLADWPIGNTQTVGTNADGQGRFRLVGLPRGRGNQILVTPPIEGAYLGEILDIAEGPPGFEPIAVEVSLRKGIPIRGRVTDRATGKPVRALVRYHAYRDNPALKGVTGLDWVFQSDWTDAGGSFRATGLPGRGLLSVQGGDVTNFLDASDNRPELTMKLSMNTTPMFAPELINGFARIELSEGDAELHRDLTVDSGRDLAGRAVDEAGNPLAGVRFSDANLKEGDAWKTLEKGEFSIEVASRPDPALDRERAALFAPDPVPTRTLLFRDEARKLAQSILIRGDQPGPVVVTLVPWATARGRVVDAEGKPRAGVEIRLSVADAAEFPARFRTDAEGRFRLDGLIPGARHEAFFDDYGATLGGPITPGSGDDLDLGDLQARPRN